MIRLDEKYRPINLKQVVGQDKIVKRLKVAGRNGYGGRAFWLSGSSGQGKTTLARIIAHTIAEPACITETVGRQLTPNKLKELMDYWRSRPLYGNGYALIVNESHGLSKPMIEIFLNVLESLPDHVAVIFTTSNEGNDLFEEQLDSSPFDSRCISLRLASRNLCNPFAKRAKEIAHLESLDGKPIEEYIKLMKSCRNNLRKALQEIETGWGLE